MDREKYLKPHQDYLDQYDRYTVENCRQIERIYGEKDIEEGPDGKELTQKQAELIREYGKKLRLFFETGERYLNKEKRIREWMDRDRRRDELYETAEAPTGIRCLACRNLVKPTFRQLWTELDKEDRVLFMYDCPNRCVPRRSFFSDGEEWRTKPNLCPKCDTPLDAKSEEGAEKIVTTSTCPKCGYVDIDECDLAYKKEEEKIDEDFPRDRDRFCLTEEEGKKYQEEKWRMEDMARFMKEWDEEQKARAEKLRQNPKGFHLDDVGYSCAICGLGTREGDNWYDEHGIKCLVCQKAIDDGEIPASLASDKDSWYSKYDMESRFNVKSPTLRKWIKNGIIKDRTVSFYGKGAHYQLFLVEDNKDFLPPKKLVESRPVTTEKDGKTWYGSEPWYRFVDPHEHLKGYKIMDHLRVVDEKKEE